MLTKILLLEDDLLLAETLTDLLEENGYEIFHAPNGQQALNMTFNNKFDMYLFDINVPLIDGLTLLKELREADDLTATIFLTSHKEMLKNAFLNGADDYITKPFDSEELLLRVNALMKRIKSQKKECINLLCHDEMHKTFFYNKEPLELSKKEYDLLLLLVQHINKAVPKELIVDALWNTSESGSEGAIRVYINRLKQLLPHMKIENIRGIGYKLVS